ncbi:MAG: hypothetical protein ACM3PP_06460 [Candidatus Saccharibacteria bacterium]
MRCRKCRTIYQGRICPNCSPPYNLPEDQILPEYSPGIWQFIDEHPVLSRIKPLIVLGITILIGLSIYGGKQLMKKTEINLENPPQSISMDDIGEISIPQDIKTLHPFKYKGLYYRVNNVPPTDDILTSASLSYSSDKFSGISADTAVIILFASKEKASREFEADQVRFKSLSLPLQTYKKLGAYDRYSYTYYKKYGNSWTHQIIVQKRNLVIIVWGYEPNIEDNSCTQKLLDAISDYLKYYERSDQETIW